MKLDESKRISREEVAKCVSAIRKLIAKNKGIVKIEFENKESNDKYNINFNGCGKKAHETFIFYSQYKESVAEEIVDSLEDKENKCNDNIISARGVFIKNNILTNRKPYDKVVKQAYMKCQAITNDKFDIECDDDLKYFKDKIIKTQGAVDYIKKGKKDITYKTLGETGKLNKYDWSK